jgi:hypothetical protein
VLSTALRLGLKPFLDLILCSPRSELGQVAETIRQAYRWTMAGCEIGLYPYVVPFSGSQMAGDAELAPYVTSNQQTIQGTNIAWSQPDHILPIDPRTRGAMQQIVTAYEEALEALHDASPHIPSRARSLLWIGCAIPVLQAAGEDVPDSELVLRKLDRALYRSEIGVPTDTTTSALAERVACA